METSRTKPKVSGSTTSEGIDRISSLPDDVLHNILSYLFIFDVVQLSVLAKRWKYIWTTMPYLHFDISTFYSEWIKRACDMEMVDQFKHFINWVLISRSTNKLVRFLLTTGDIFSNVDILRWIHALTRWNVREFVLNVELGEPFELPYCLVTCESLKVLKLQLHGDILKLPTNHLGFRQLRFLHLVLVDLHLTGCLFSKCHLLKNLILEDCSLGAMTLLDIASTSLIDVTLRNDSEDVDSFGNCEIKISCPNLKFLKYQATMPKDIIIKNLFSIEAVRIFFYDRRSREETGVLVRKMLEEVPSASVLKLCNASIWGLYEVAHKRRLFPVSFCKLKYLKLTVKIMILLFKSSPNLEVLKLCFSKNGGWIDCWQIHVPDESIVCLESRLKSIRLAGFKDEQNEIELARFVLKNALVLEKLTIVWASQAHKSEETAKEVVKFPRTSIDAVLTFLDA